MPTTIENLFLACDLDGIKSVKWGQSFNENKEGIYVISTSDNPFENSGTMTHPIFNNNEINNWIKNVPNFLIDGNYIKAEKLKKRLEKFWISDENILYIGKAPLRKVGGGLHNRVNEYYNTKIGNGGPHSGGQWIKALKNINDLYVYYGCCDNSKVIEHKMLQIFRDNVSPNSLKSLFDMENPLPFANIRHIGDKNHGLKNQRL